MKTFLPLLVPATAASAAVTAASQAENAAHHILHDKHQKMRRAASKSGKTAAEVGPTKHSKSKSGKRSKGKAGKASPFYPEMFMNEYQVNQRSMSIMTPAPTLKPTTPKPTTPNPTNSPMPTLTDCDNPGTCQNRLSDLIFALSVRMGTVDALSDPSSPQSRASDWIIEECDARPLALSTGYMHHKSTAALTPIDPCTGTQELIEQRYALAVMYFGLGGDSWNAGANPGLDAAAPPGQWMSGLNYCEWGAEVSGQGGSFNQLVCDEFGNVLNLNLRKYHTTNF